MSFSTQEKRVKSILSKSGIPGVDYCINPYVGCGHGCRYCYATFMKRYTGHLEDWGSFVDIKINAPEVLRRQISKGVKGHVMISSVTDPYQPLEKKYELTRRCLEVLLQSQLSVGLLTKSPLVLRDLDLIRKFKEIEVGMTITTDDDAIRRIFEPHAPPIERRLHALRDLCESGIRTYAFIGPLLPMNPEGLAKKIAPYVDSILVDRMNYISKTSKLYKERNLSRWLDDAFLYGIIERLKKGLPGKEVRLC